MLDSEPFPGVGWQCEVTLCLSSYGLYPWSGQRRREMPLSVLRVRVWVGEAQQRVGAARVWVGEAQRRVGAARIGVGVHAVQRRVGVFPVGRFSCEVPPLAGAVPAVAACRRGWRWLCPVPAVSACRRAWWWLCPVGGQWIQLSVGWWHPAWVRAAPVAASCLCLTDWPTLPQSATGDAQLWLVPSSRQF